MPKAFIFDFDGTIVDSESHWPEISRRMYEKMTGKEWTEADQNRMVGQGMKDAHAIVTSEYGVSMDYQTYFRMVEEHSAVIYDSQANLCPGIAGVFDILKKKHVPMAIASSGHIAWIRAASRRLGIEKYFPVICTAEDVQRTKPYPDVYLLAAQKLGIDPARCIAVEDSNPGVRSAKAAGMTCIAYRTHHNAAQDLSMADMHIRSFDELTDARLDTLLA